jgi:hypothetical protein
VAQYWGFASEAKEKGFVFGFCSKKNHDGRLKLPKLTLIILSVDNDGS